MNNEPVAWMDKRTNKCVVFINTPPSDDWIPLYTHPVKELTDEEIYEILWMHFPISEKEKNATMIAVMTHCIKTALRKANEK